MNKMLYVMHQYVTKVLLVPLLAYAFLTHGCPTCSQKYTVLKNQSDTLAHTGLKTILQERANA